jgi:hypothetical protein
MDTTTLQTPAAPTTPDPYADKSALRDRADKKVKAWGGATRAGFLQAAKGNLLFRSGHQWIRPVGNQYGDWRPAVVKKGTPMPVTNLTASVMKTFTSMLARYEPALTFRPATDDPEDRATADVASRVTEAIEAQVQMPLIRQLLGEWVGWTGGAWLETGWDASLTHGVVNLPMEICTLCGSTQVVARDPVCQQPGCGGPTQDVTEITAVPKGKIFVEVRSLFEMLFDPFTTDPTKHRILIRQTTLDEDNAKARWKDFAEAIRADSVAAHTNLSQDSLAVVTPGLGDLQMGSVRALWQHGGSTANTRVTETWYWELPSEAYPDGILAIFLGKSLETCVHGGPLPYSAKGEGEQREPFLPFTFFPQELVPGSAWPRTVCNDVRPKNAQRNLWESLVIMAGQRVANPVWLIPAGCNVSNPTGEPGQVMTYNALAGGKPERVQGTQINPSWMLNIERIDKEIQELTAIFEVLSGGRPEGISAGIALQILKERGESRFGPMFQLWHHAWAQWAKQAIEIARLYDTEAHFLQIKGADGAWEVQKFMAADLQGRVNVVPEAGMSLPRSTMTERAEIGELVSMGVLNPLDPETRLKLLEKYGLLAAFAPSMELDAKAAIKENEAFKALAADPSVQAASPALVERIKATALMAQQAGQPPTVALAEVERMFAAAGLPVPTLRPAIDAHDIHGREQRKTAKSETFATWPELVRVFMELHIAAHDFLQGQAMQMLMAAQRPGASPPGPDKGSAPSTSPMRGASSPQALQGQNREMETRMGMRG